MSGDPTHDAVFRALRLLADQLEHNETRPLTITISLPTAA